MCTLAMAAVTLFFALNPGKLMDRIGKLLTPILLIMLGAIAVSAYLFPHSETSSIAKQYQEFAFASGLSEGYMTMDVLGAVGFGWLVMNAIKEASPKSAVLPSMTRVVLIYSVAMSLVYIAIAFVGANYGQIETNGGAILSNYMNWIYGVPGVVLLGFVIFMACLTTAIGLTCASAGFVSKNFKGCDYKVSAIVIVAVTTLVANLGLDMLIAITLPLVVVLHPVAISVICLALINTKRPVSGAVYSLTLITAIAGGIIDALKILETMPTELHSLFTQYLPLYQYNAGWLLPTLAVFVLTSMSLNFAKSPVKQRSLN